MTARSAGVLTPAGPPTVDPRMRARRIAVRRAGARKRLRALVAAGALLAVVASALLVARSPLLQVDRIRVSGAERTGADAVRAASGISLHTPMIDVDTSSVRSRLLALPWVASVSVHRQWPNSLTVSVVERTAVAAVAAGQAGVALLDQSGRVLEVDPTAPAGVVALSGFASPGAVGSTAPADSARGLAVAAALPPSLKARVAAVAAADDGAVDLHLASGGVAHLGTPDALPAKLLAVLTVLDQVDLTDLCGLDVRVPSAPSLTRASPCL